MTTPVTSPSITGYTPDIAEVSSQEITHDSASLTTVVTYTAGEQTVKVHYIDVYGTESDLTAGKELTAQMQTITGVKQVQIIPILYGIMQRLAMSYSKRNQRPVQGPLMKILILNKTTMFT